jgi:hypothetical protein
MGETFGAEKPEGKRKLGRPRLRCKKIINKWIFKSLNGMV